MKDIDFLPNRYHEQGARRKAQAWRIMLLILFGGVCAASAVGQQFVRRSVESQIDAIAPAYASADATNRLLEKLQEELKSADSEAALYAFLHHPWPRTQILAALVKPLNESVYLSELQIHDEAKLVQRPEQGRPQNNLPPEASQIDRLPSQVDLERLQADRDGKQTVVTLVGQTTDISALHRYVTELGRVRLFSTAKLVSLHSIEDKSQQPRSQFNVRVIVRPGYGASNSNAEQTTMATYDPHGDA
jgi:Tfp pilus assembly protein PilN